MKDTKISPADALRKAAVQETRQWRREQIKALTDQQRLMYRMGVENGRHKLQEMATEFKANRDKLIEEEFRKRLLHHPAPVFSMLPVRPKTQEKLRQEATHEVDRQHHLRMTKERQEQRRQLDQYLKIAAEQRERKEKMGALFKDKFDQAKAHKTLSQSDAQGVKQETFSDNGKWAMQGFRKSDYFTKEEAVELLGQKVSKRTDYGHDMNPDAPQLQKGAAGEVFRIEHVMEGAYEVSVAWGEKKEKQTVIDYDKHLFSDDVELVRNHTIKR